MCRRKKGRDERIDYSRDSWVTWLLSEYQILLFIQSELRHTATGHVQKLNDCKESEWQANGLLWECEEALCGKLCGCTHCLLGDICSITVAHYWVVFFLVFSLRVLHRLHRNEKGSFMLCSTGAINLLSVRLCFLEKQPVLD